MSSEAPFDVDRAHRWFGVECNNAIFRYFEMPVRTMEETERMLQFAHAALLHWQQFSGHKPVNTVRGVSMLASAYAYAGRPTEAIHYAEWNLRLIEQYDSEVADFDRVYASMGMARALASKGDNDKAAQWKQRCAAEIEAVVNEEDKKICLADFAAGPWYGIAGV